MRTVMFTKGKEKKGRGQGGKGVQKCERACPFQKFKGLSDVIVFDERSFSCCGIETYNVLPEL